MAKKKRMSQKEIRRFRKFYKDIVRRSNEISEITRGAGWYVCAPDSNRTANYDRKQSKEQ